MVVPGTKEFNREESDRLKPLKKCASESLRLRFELPSEENEKREILYKSLLQGALELAPQQDGSPLCFVDVSTS